VAVKSEAQQAATGLHKVREMLVKQRTMLMNQLRGLMAEFGIVVGKGPQHVGKLVAILSDPADERIPLLLRGPLIAIGESLRGLAQRLARLDRQILDWGRSNDTYQHLLTIPGYGPILASALAAMTIDPAALRSGRGFAASLGLVPRQEGTGGKVKLGPISKRAKQDPWLVKLLASKPRKLVAVALANKMARIGWALMMRQEDYRNMPAAA